MKGGKLLNVSCSTISSLDKKLTNAQLCQKWKTIGWHQVEKSFNKLQTRITKAVHLSSVNEFYAQLRIMSIVIFQQNS